VQVLDLLVFNAMLTLTVEAARNEAELRSLVLATVRRLLGPLVAAAALLAVAAPLILFPFGADYTEKGSIVLVLLACAIPFRMVGFIYNAVCRFHGFGLRMVAAQAAGVALLIGLTFLLGETAGLTGIALAWLASAALVAAVAGPLLPGLMRVRPGGSPESRRPVEVPA
jgi:O-antigen/teichoic acid export membrane protein